MSFQAPDWDKDTLGDQTHGDLFKKKSHVVTSKNKIKQKRKIKKIVRDLPPPKNKNVFVKSAKNGIQKTHSFKDGNKNKKITKVIQKVDESPAKLPKQKKRPIVKKVNLPSAKTYSSKSENILKKSSQKIKKKLKRLERKKMGNNENVSSKAKTKIGGLDIGNLKKQLAVSLEKGRVSNMSLRERMLEKLKAARFRYLNEQMYTSEGKEAEKLFKSDPGAFEAYHQGYQQQVSRWPLNPLDTIISAIKKLPDTNVIVDFGCGEARLSSSVPQQTVHSFDLVSVNEQVVACDMARVPLRNSSADVAVFCLSLMGTNLKDYLAEANRVLKIGGTLKIAEVESRFESIGIDVFVLGLQKYGFKNTWQDLSHNLFHFLDFVKERDIKYKNKLPSIGLSPCLYKKR